MMENEPDITEIKNRAANGDPYSQHLLGCKYATGEMRSNGTNPDYPRAIELIRNAANKGWSESQYTLGCMYAQGHGAAQDYQKAYFWVYLSQMHLHDSSLPQLKELKPFKDRLDAAKALKDGISALHGAAKAENIESICTDAWKIMRAHEVSGESVNLESLFFNY